ncbi:MAG: hypothetical protein PHT54_04220 [Candidatus Nanoarchaeia archaeon]|nr:hypothetical protein [Candidatus Nanoarchaeia archaeon]
MKQRKLFWILNFILGGYFLYRIIDQSKILRIFPLNYTNDVGSYMASLFFMAKCGLNNLCPYWYNGFVAFTTYSPGWQFFTMPFYWITNNILTATWISWILMFILGFIFILILGKNERWNLSKIIFFFLFLFGNAVAVGGFIREGRMPAMFGFVFILAMFALVLYYKNRDLDWKFFVYLILIEVPLILSHPQEALLGQFLLLGLFLIKNLKEKIKIAIGVVLSLLITMFWWLPFIKNLGNNNILGNVQGGWIWVFSGTELLTQVVGFLVPLALLILFYFYYKQKKSILFFSPILALALLFMLRLTPFIPFLRNISPDPFIMLFLIFVLYFLLSIRLFPKFIEKMLPVLLIMIVLFSVGISHFKTPYFWEYTQGEYDMLELLPYGGDRFFMVYTAPKTSHPKSFYAYVPIYYNYTTPGGFYPQIPTKEYDDLLYELPKMVFDGNCERTNELINELNINYLFAYASYCDRLKECGYENIRNSGKACLFYSGR